jgi:hypothetical protein
MTDAPHAADTSRPTDPHAGPAAASPADAKDAASSTAVVSPSAARRHQRLATPRLQRELRTLAAMIAIGCRDRHGPAVADGLCPDCAALLAYARRRLAACPFGAAKPTCTNCRIHCYGPTEREAVRTVMRYAGPRMIWRHPLLALAHVLDGRRAAPPNPRQSKQEQAGSPR